MTNSQGRIQSAEANPETTQMSELSYKDFKAAL